MYQHTDDSWTDNFPQGKRCSICTGSDNSAEHLKYYFYPDYVVNIPIPPMPKKPIQAAMDVREIVFENAARSQRHRAGGKAICILMSMHPIVDSVCVHGIQ